MSFPLLRLLLKSCENKSHIPEFTFFMLNARQHLYRHTVVSFIFEDIQTVLWCLNFVDFKFYL